VRRIAILSSNIYPAAEAIRDGFVNEISLKPAAYRYLFKSLVGLGGADQMRAYIHEALDRDFDLLFAIGAETTALAKEITEERQQLTPILFCNVKDPIKLGFVKSFAYSNNHLTGVMSFSHDHQEQLAALCNMRPNLETALLINGSHVGIEGGVVAQDTRDAIAFLAQRGVRAVDFPIGDNRKFVHARLFHALCGAPYPKLMIVLRDERAMASLTDIASCAEETHTPLFTADTSSIRYGATFGCGSPDRQIGADAAYRAYRMIENGYRPNKMPLVITRKPYRIVASGATMMHNRIDPTDASNKWLMENAEIL